MPRRLRGADQRKGEPDGIDDGTRNGHCSRYFLRSLCGTVKDAVGALPGVASVEADADTKRVEIDFDPGRVSLAQIEAALDEAGYPVAK